MKITVKIFCVLILSSYFLSASEISCKNKTMVHDLRVLKHHYTVGYALLDWKKQYGSWDFQEAFERAERQIKENPNITTKEFHKILKNFCASLHDYHVNIYFNSTEKATLPFGVKEVEGRYFIRWIDENKMEDGVYGLCIGDELLEFGDEPISKVIENLKKTVGSKSSNRETDAAMTAISLTYRSGKLGDDIPKGPIRIRTKSHRLNRLNAYQLIWDYQPEKVLNPLDFLQTTTIFKKLARLNDKACCEDIEFNMINPLFLMERGEGYKNNRWVCGSELGFVPILGEIVWENNGFDEEMDKTDDEEDFVSGFVWNSYIYKNQEGKLIGYIRIPSFISEDVDIRSFGPLIQKMENTVEALVIDQTDNPGGNVHLMYQFASMLTTEPLKTGTHRIKLTYEDVVLSLSFLQDFKNKKWSSESFLSHNYIENLFRKSYHQFILDEWNSGRTLTNPGYLLHVDMINPHLIYQFTKPIVILINEMDFSCADYFPALFQDSLGARVTLFGARTAGAGGCVKKFNFLNSSGIDYATCTFTSIERENSQKIENIGVIPDIEYKITVNDILNGYVGYASALNQTIKTILEPTDIVD